MDICLLLVYIRRLHIGMQVFLQNLRYLFLNQLLQIQQQQQLRYLHYFRQETVLRQEDVLLAQRSSSYLLHPKITRAIWSFL